MRTVSLRVPTSKAVIAAGLTFLALCVLGYFAYRQATFVPSATTQIPSNVVKQTSMPVYAPTTPPQGFSLQENTISNTNEAFIYSYMYDEGKTLAVSVQPIPKDFDAKKFNPDKEFQSSIGRAYLVDLETRTTAAVVAKDALIFINAPEKIAVDTLEDFINSMKRAQ